MTILFVDSFDHYATAELSDKGYSNPFPGNHDINIGGGRRATNSLRAAGLNGGAALTKSFTGSDTVVMGFAWRTTVFDSTLLMGLNDSGGTRVASLSQTGSGELSLLSGGVTVTTASSFFSPGNYSYYELKYTKGTGADGFAEVRKDGIVVLTITTSTETAQATSVTINSLGSGSQTSDVDDLYILNGLGSAPTNDYLGSIRIDAHFADADGATTDFTPNTGAANYTHVDELLPDGDTTYNQAGSIGDLDLHSMDAATLSTTIYAVQPVVYAKQTDAGTVTVELITQKPGGAGEKSSGTSTASTSYQFEHHILENDPDDTTTWTDTKVNATEFGYKINNIVT